MQLITLLDIFFRLACIGQLILFALMVVSRNRSSLNNLLASILVCLCGYFLLTFPVSVPQLKDSRWLLLTLTDAMPLLFWLFALKLFNNQLPWSSLHLTIKLALVGFAIWHGYFFAVLLGIGFYHDLSHFVGLVAMLHIVYISIGGLRDDLVERRRKVRILFVVLITVEILLLEMVELLNQALAYEAIFSAANSGLLLLLSSAIGLYILGFDHDDSLPQNLFEQEPEHQQQQQQQSSAINQSVPAAYHDLHQQLIMFMEQGGYRQSNLSISQLAKTLSSQEHRLRYLINQCLGYRNFSSYLNEYRIKQACLQLIAESRLPILTIALDLGYGSIGPFNRAFKNIIGDTPSQYRDFNIR